MFNIQLNTQLSPTAKKTLRSIHDKGGRATARTGQPGINPNSFRLCGAVGSGLGATAVPGVELVMAANHSSQ